MKNMRNITLLVLLLSLSGCLAKQSLIKNNSYENKLKVSGNIVEIVISDLRPNITDREIKIPLITFPGMKDEISPLLRETTNTAIKNALAVQFTENSDVNYNAVVKINKGLIGFKAFTFSEKQYTNIELEILLTDQFGNNKNYSSILLLSNKSIDASQKYTNQLFERALINAIHKCFNNKDE
jgi:aspartyl/asparaginyl-tRNA synthetase